MQDDRKDRLPASVRIHPAGLGSIVSTASSVVSTGRRLTLTEKVRVADYSVGGSVELTGRGVYVVFND